MPVKQRVAKRRIDPALELKAWATTFRTGHDYLRDLPKVGVPLGAMHRPPRCAIEEAWRRLGRAFLDGRDRDAPPAWAEREFGVPGGGGTAMIRIGELRAGVWRASTDRISVAPSPAIDDRRGMALHDPDQIEQAIPAKPRVVELFCGTGGFSRGAHAAGLDVVAAYDRDPILTSSFRTNFPNTPLHLRNVAWLTGERLRRDAGGAIDGIIGGPPCQGFSEMGRMSADDPRRGLLRHFFRLVAEVRPRFFVMENVRGLGFPSAKATLDAALDLVREGYDLLGPVVWDAASFGAATTRPRLFVIGVRKDLRRPMKAVDVTTRQRSRASVEDAIADLVAAKACGEDTAGFDRWKTTRPCRPATYAIRLRRGGIFTGHRFTDHAAKVVERFAAIAQGGFDTVGRHPRLSWSGLCPTLRAGTGADRGSFQSVRPIHPTENRVITVREAARLQGFPDDHRFHPTVWHSFRMIGNSVSPFIGEAVLAAVRDRLMGPVDQPTPSLVEREPAMAPA